MLYSQPEGKVFGTVDKYMRRPSQAHTPFEGISYAVRGCLIRRLWSEAPEGKKTRQNMAFFKKQQLKSNGKWYPRSVTVGKPVTTDEVAARLSQISTVSRADTYAVLKDLGLVLGDYMAQGRTVKLEGVGTFQADNERPRALHSRNGAQREQSGGDPLARSRQHLLGGMGRLDLIVRRKQ